MRNFTNRRGRIAVAVALVAALVGSGAAAASAAKDKSHASCDPAHPGFEAQAGKDKCVASDSTEQGVDIELPAPFTDVDAFATKTGFRGVVSWAAETPIAPVVRYGTDPEALDEVAPVLDAPDTAGMVVIGDGTAVRLDVGTTYYVSVEDQITGVATPPIELVAKNAYSDLGPNGEQDPDEVSFKPDVYTIDLLVQLDSQSLPADTPSDQALDDLAEGVNVFAERLYDAMDGYARVGNVLITDTNVSGLGATPGVLVVHQPGSCDAPGNMADVLVTTAVPFDSHTFHYAIDEPCTPFYLGRFGQLVVPWEDDLHLGAVATHEMMHYAFGAPDLYGTGDITGTESGGCRNLAWDGSVMHNSGGWSGDHWELTELDSDPTLTPCDHAGEPYTWDEVQSRYDAIPDRSALEDVFNDKARGNPDGGALDISILDRDPGSSTLRHITPDDTSTEGTDCSGRTTTTSTSFADASGDATSVVGLADGPAETNEPALDILAEHVQLDDASQTLTIEVALDDLKEEPPPGALGEFFDINFAVGDNTFDVVASWDRSEGEPTYTLNEFDGSRVEVGPIAGSWDTTTNLVTVVVPAEITLADSSAYTVFAPGQSIRSFETTSRRDAGVFVPDADRASGGCAVEVPGAGEELPPGGPDATLSLANPTYSFHGEQTTAAETVLAGPVAATGSDLDEKLIEVIAPEGAILRASLIASPSSYASIEIAGMDGQLDYSEAPAGQTATVAASVSSGLYRVVVKYYASVESTYEAVLNLTAEEHVTGTPADSAELSTGQTATFEGTAPTDNLAYECTGPFDTSCVTYQIDVNEGGELSAFVEATLPSDDYDLAIYNEFGAPVASGGLPLTPPGGLESVSAMVEPGTYYLVVQPYTAIGGVSAFTLTVSLA
ncbi:MAG: hypothetical protein ACOYXM_17185 [Actinomycetota bacterium]